MAAFPQADAQAITALPAQIIGRLKVLVQSLINWQWPANATVLLPEVVKGKHNSLFRWGDASADVLFEIAIVSINNASGAQPIAESAAPTTKYQAILTHGLI
jgi:hypothetical protein